MPWVGFEPTIPASELEKTVRALDRMATVIGISISASQKINFVFITKGNRLMLLG
jgi:hypothetical protein